MSGTLDVEKLSEIFPALPRDRLERAMLLSHSLDEAVARLYEEEIPHEVAGIAAMGVEDDNDVADELRAQYRPVGAADRDDGYDCDSEDGDDDGKGAASGHNRRGFVDVVSVFLPAIAELEVHFATLCCGLSSVA